MFHHWKDNNRTVRPGEQTTFTTNKGLLPIFYDRALINGTTTVSFQWGKHFLVCYAYLYEATIGWEQTNSHNSTSAFLLHAEHCDSVILYIMYALQEHSETFHTTYMTHKQFLKENGGGPLSLLNVMQWWAFGSLYLEEREEKWFLQKLTKFRT